MIDAKEVTDGHGCESNCSLVPKIEAVDCDKGWLLVGGASFGEDSSSERLRIYSRRKRRKMSNSDELVKSGFNDKNKAADGSAFDRYVHRLSFGVFSNGPGECSLRKCSNVVSQETHQSLNGHEGCIQNAHVAYPESDCTPVVKVSLDNVERSDNQTQNSAPEHSLVLSSELLKQSEESTNSELCGRALSDTLKSEKFSELCSLLLKNFGVVDDNRVLDVDAIYLKLKNGAYETSPMLYLKDIQQACTKLQEVGNEMVTLAKSLSDISTAHYKQYVRKPGTAEACDCQGCGEKADVKNCLVCDSCEDIYHLSCTELVGTPIPPKSWYCASCVSSGIGLPHDGCIVCEKVKSAASVPLVTSFTTNNQSQDVPDGLDEHLHNGSTDGSQSQISNICFICKSEVKKDDNFRKCGHSLCAHEYYHYKCLTSKQLGVYAPYWYCPSCLCGRCLVDKDDDLIVLCDACDQAYHIYCASPQLDSIPEGSWFCEKCVLGLKKIRTVRRVYENMQKKVKIEDELKKDEHDAPVTEHDAPVTEHEAPVTEVEAPAAELEGINMLATAAKTLSH